MKKRDVFAPHFKGRDFLFALGVLPFVFWGFYLFEYGFDWISGVLGAVLFFVFLPVLIVLWDGK